jgi:thiol-disulfide isomerase/thioredoxin
MRLRLCAPVAAAVLIIPLAAAAFNFAATGPKPVPELTFLDEGGEEVALGDFAGDVVVLNLWATWCAPCRREMPSLDRLQAELREKGLRVVALSLDRGDVGKVRDFFEELEIANLAIYQDPEARAGRELGAPGLPTTVVIDRAGQEVGRLLGPAEWDSADALALLETILESSGAAD